jgi:GTP cyclohydrolase I
MKTQATQDVDEPTRDGLSDVFHDLIDAIDEDPDRDGLSETWKRRGPEMWQALTEGYDEANKPAMTSFPADTEGLVVKTDIPFYSLCEHHLLPFFGRVHIGYLPDTEMVGLSKLIRYTQWRARKLLTQERLTSELAEGLSEELDAKSVIVAVEAEHMCESMRGVEVPDTMTTTTAATGRFDPSAQDPTPRREFFEQVDRNR